ncbi:MAG: urease accessory UreF family protein, partial [Egibacteraceae bacterium]
AAASAGLSPCEAAACAAYDAVAGPCAAAVRLLGLDPFAVTRLLAEMSEQVVAVSDEAAQAAAGPLRELPAPAATLVEVAAEDHARWEVRLFAS